MTRHVEHCNFLTPICVLGFQDSRLLPDAKTTIRDFCKNGTTTDTYASTYTSVAVDCMTGTSQVQASKLGFPNSVSLQVHLGHFREIDAVAMSILKAMHLLNESLYSAFSTDRGVAYIKLSCVAVCSSLW